MWSGNRRVTGDIVTVVGVLLAIVGLIAGMLRPDFAPDDADGIGDPYLPTAGGSGYDVTHYDIDVEVDPKTAYLTGTTTLAAVATSDISTIHLDLLPLTSAVRVNGRAASFRQRGDDLAVASALTTGTAFTVEVEYTAELEKLTFTGTSPVYHGDSELLISGEPEAAAAWFPANDHPRDPATYDVTVSVPRDVEAISIGQLLGHEPDPDRPGRDRWRWRTEQPGPTYATMIAVGQYRIEQGEAEIGGKNVAELYAVSEGVANPDEAMAWLKTSPASARRLSTLVGVPYPYDSIGGVVPGLGLAWGGLETVGRPVYFGRLAGDQPLLHHELAHMWFGDTVTLYEWNDLFINESLASYVEQMVSAEAGDGPDPQRIFDAQYADQPGYFWRQKLSDPGPGDQLFSRVYDRGAMTLHALRVRMGDDAFGELLRRWASQSGPHSLEEFRQMAIEVAPVDVAPLLAAWLDSSTKVPKTAENGFVV